MRNIVTAAIMPVLAALAFGCTSSTALQTSEPDDLYYASSDRTVRPGMAAGTSESTFSEADGNASQSGSTEYYDPEAASQTSITNNYYYDDDRYYSSRGRRNYMYYNDPFYSPFGYSAAYCYGIYDPFCFPGYYPYSGLTVSISYGWGSPWGYYGYRPYGAYGYGYRPYDYGYGGGYGGYYQGFYDGYYAGGGGYGYGYNRSRVNYGPRTNRSNVPAHAPAAATTGRPASPGRVAQPNTNSGSVIPGGARPHRVAQPGVSGSGQPAGNQPSNGRQQTGRPTRETQVQPENYQFQNAERPSPEPNRPVRDNAVTPARPDRAPDRAPTPEISRPAQEEPVQTTQPERAPRQQPRPTYQPQPSEQRSAPVYENSRPARSNSDGGSYQAPGRGSSGSSMPSGGVGRPRR